MTKCAARKKEQPRIYTDYFMERMEYTPEKDVPQYLWYAVERAEVETIRAALAATDGRRNDAAEILGISRKTLWEKVKMYGITVDS